MKQVSTLVLLASMFTCCKSAPEPTKDKELSKKAAANKALDDVDLSDVITKRTYSTKLKFEKAPEVGKQIDGDSSDWKSLPFKIFDKKKFVESGESFWSGPKDLSTRIALYTDAGWVYFFIQVKDDNVVVGTGDEIADGVQIAIRDPGLDDLQTALPKGMGLGEYITETSVFTFLPDGRVLDDDGNDFEGAESGVDEKENGYYLEVAFPLEAFGSVSSLPLEEMAFRIDILDGDDAENVETQTVFSTVPTSIGAGKRFAKVPVNLRPQKKLETGIPRKNAIGRWKYEDGGWGFVSFEVVPQSWKPLNDLAAFESELKENESITSLCNFAKNDFALLDAYRSSGGGFSAGLVVCGTKVRQDKCSAKAKTNLYWIKAEKDGEEWDVSETINVFSKSLNQCLNQSDAGAYFSDFSVFPLDMLGKNFWMVGWSGMERRDSYRATRNGVTFLNTGSDRSIIGNLITNSDESGDEARLISNTSTYLALLDDDQAIDICQREVWEEQSCSGFLRGCEEEEKGMRHNIYMWNKVDSYFETYGLIKHKKCRTSYDLQQQKSFLILQLKKRIGLLSFSADEW